MYAFTSLPMGLSSSPRVFTKVMKPVFAYLRSQFGHTCLGYIDDSFYLENSYMECELATLRAVQLIISLGFYLRSQFGHTCLGYIDDSFYLENSYMECELATLRAVQLIISLGFKVYAEKSVMIIPTQTLEFLGFVLDSIRMIVRKKVDKILQLCQKFSHPYKQFTILWTLVSSFPGVQFGPLHYRQIEVDKERNLQLNQGNFDTFMTLSE